MEPINVENHGTRLQVTYTWHPGSDPESKRFVVLLHGICHTREQFREPIRELNKRGLNVAMVDMQSEDARRRNWIRIGHYRRGFAAAVRQILEKHSEQTLLGYALHSMGAFIGEGMQRRHRDLRRPTVLMAPIPAYTGAIPITWRLLRRRGWEFVKAVLRGDIVSLADEQHEVKELFLTKGAHKDHLAQVHGRLKHAPLLAYIQLVIGASVWPWSGIHKQPRLLLTSNEDGIFARWEYRWTRRIYRQLAELNVPGGHDFFIPEAEGTAWQIVEFFKAPEEFVRSIKKRKQASTTLKVSPASDAEPTPAGAPPMQGPHRIDKGAPSTPHPDRESRNRREA